MKEKVTDYELLDCGIEHSQYFQGVGTAFSKFDYAYVGVGDDYGEAINDALEQAACSGHEVPITDEELQADIDATNDVSCSDEEYHDEIYYYAAVRVKVDTAPDVDKESFYDEELAKEFVENLTPTECILFRDKLRERIIRDSITN